MRNFLNYIKQIFLAWLILFGISFVHFVFIMVFWVVLTLITNPFYLLGIAIYSRLLFVLFCIFLIGIIMLIPALFAVKIFKESKKFVSLGIKTSPYFWAIGVFLPTTIFVFPLYLIKRNILWDTKESNSSVLNKEAIQSKNKFKKRMKIFGVIIGLFLIYIVAFGFVVSNRTKSSFRPIISSIVRSNLEDNCNKRPSCDELRPIPKILQNKKIVFNKNTKIQFDPYTSSIKSSQLDILGFLDTQGLVDGEKVNFIDPTLGKSGYLEDREYKIVRAVYSYKCSYCIDSSDLAYLVIENSKGNRFLVLLDQYDQSISPGKSLSWDEYIPYFLGKDSEGKEILEAKLENI